MGEDVANVMPLTSSLLGVIVSWMMRLSSDPISGGVIGPEALVSCDHPARRTEVVSSLDSRDGGSGGPTWVVGVLGIFGMGREIAS